MSAPPQDRSSLTPFAVVRGLAPGVRARVTWPDGTQRVGVIGRVRVGLGEHLTTHDGLLVGGEYATAATVEVMGATGRYMPRWNAPPHP